MILGAGHGTRLGEETSRVPKILVDLGGEALLARQLRYLHRQGVDRVIVNAHHHAEQVLAFGARYRGPLELVVLAEPRLLGTAGGVRNALPILGTAAFIVLYGDVLIAESLGPMLALHAARSAAITLAVYDARETRGKGVVEVGENGLVRAFREKRGNRAGLVNAGLYVVDPAFIAALPVGATLDFGETVIPDAVAAGIAVSAFNLAGPALDIGTPAALREARSNARAADGRRAPAT